MGAENFGYGLMILVLLMLFSAIVSRYVLRTTEPTFENEPDHADPDFELKRILEVNEQVCRERDTYQEQVGFLSDQLHKTRKELFELRGLLNKMEANVKEMQK